MHPAHGAGQLTGRGVLDHEPGRARLQAAAEEGVIGPGDAANLVEAFRFLRGLAYRHHAAQIARGLPQDNNVDPSTLSGKDRHRLRAAFRIIAAAQDALALRYRVGQM